MCLLFHSVSLRTFLCDRKGIWPLKSVPLIPKRFVLEQSEEENRGGWLNWLTQVHLEMS